MRNQGPKPLLSTSKLSALRWSALISYFALLSTVLLWNTVLSPSTQFPVGLVLLFTALPLLFPLWGMLNGKAYTHAWVSFLALYYFLIGVGDAYADPVDRIYGYIVVALSCTLFLSCMYYARYQGRQDKQQPITENNNS